MQSIGRLAAVALAVCALSAAPPRAAAEDPVDATVSGFVQFYDGGLWIGAEADPYGWVLTTTRTPTHGGADLIAYLDGSGADLDFLPYKGRFCEVHGLLRAKALSAGGLETPLRQFDQLAAYEVDSASDPFVPRGRDARLQSRIDRDVERRGLVDFHGATPTPSPGITEFGRLWSGREAHVVSLALVATFPESPTIYDFAFVDLRRGRYWARRTVAGVAGAQWIGPFRLPRANVARVTMPLGFTLDGR